MCTEVRPWTAVEIRELRDVIGEEEEVAFVVWHMLPTDEIPKLMSHVPPPDSWLSNPLFGETLKTIIGNYDVVPVEWVIQRENAILSRINSERQPWLNRVTMALEALGHTINLMKTGNEGDWIRWTERICREVKFVCSHMTKELRSEVSWKRGKREFPMLGICEDWRLEFMPFLEIPTILSSGFQEQILRKLERGLSEQEIGVVVKMIKSLLLDYKDSTREYSQSIGHEIVFWACICRRAVWQEVKGAPAEGDETRESLWQWSLWEPKTQNDTDMGIAFGWGEGRPMGYMDRYLDMRANPIEMDPKGRQLLGATSEFMWSIFRATDAIQESIDAAADNQTDEVGSIAWRAGLAKTVVHSMATRSLVTRRELARVCADDELAASYAIDLDNECRSIRATCCLVSRVITLSVGQATGRGPFVPHRGVLFDGPVPTGEDAHALKRVASESFAALCRVGAEKANVTRVQNRRDDANAMVVAATVMASHFKTFSHVQTCTDIVATCASRFINETQLK